jgi:sugar-specific transcriptional regulator TrmB
MEGIVRSVNGYKGLPEEVIISKLEEEFKNLSPNTVKKYVTIARRIIEGKKPRSARAISTALVYRMIKEKIDNVVRDLVEVQNCQQLFLDIQQNLKKATELTAQITKGNGQTLDEVLHKFKESLEKEFNPLSVKQYVREVSRLIREQNKAMAELQSMVNNSDIVNLRRIRSYLNKFLRFLEKVYPTSRPMSLFDFQSDAYEFKKQKQPTFIVIHGSNELEKYVADFLKASKLDKTPLNSEQMRKLFEQFVRWIDNYAKDSGARGVVYVLDDEIEALKLSSKITMDMILKSNTISSFYIQFINALVTVWNR